MLSAEHLSARAAGTADQGPDRDLPRARRAARNATLMPARAGDSPEEASKAAALYMGDAR
jgi:hypothetical protein